MLAQLDARGFRNLEPLSRPFGPGAHLVLGDNGAGKTSLLEAIYLLATTRSFRTSRVADCARHGERAFRLTGEVSGEQRRRLEVGWEGGVRHRSLNDGRSSLAEHLATLPVIAWTAGDRELLTGPPLARRRFLDRGLVGLRPAAIEVLGRYRKALAEKRQLLLQGGGELAPWNTILAEAAGELISLRARYVERLAGVLGELFAATALDLPPVELRYRPSPRVGLGGIGSETPVEAVAEALAAAVESERRQARPLLGPHLDELVVRWQGHPIRRVASAGERKLLGLILAAAQGRVLAAAGRPPTYLLDDADAELDRGRLAGAWKAFAGVGQLFATSNRPEVWAEVPFEKVLRCVRGDLSEHPAAST